MKYKTKENLRNEYKKEIENLTIMNNLMEKRINRLLIAIRETKNKLAEHPDIYGMDNLVYRLTRVMERESCLALRK